MRLHIPKFTQMFQNIQEGLVDISNCVPMLYLFL